MDSRLKIAFLTSLDPTDRASWSGTYFSMAQALQKHCGDVFYLGPVPLKRSTALVRIIARGIRTLSGKSYDWSHNPWLAIKYGRIFTEKLRSKNCDFIFAPAAATELAYVETSKPVVYLSDTTFGNMIDYYPTFTNLLEISKNHGLAIERAAVSKSSLLLYPSAWAIRSAITEFGAPHDKTHVVAFGANLDEIPPAGRVLNKKTGSFCRLLFLGVDWARKGGNIAFDTLRELNKRGVKTELTICGCIPPAGFRHENMRIIPYLNKNRAEDKKSLIDLFLNSHFLLLPTRAECTGIVFSEASAFGLPSITTDTGGVSSAVTDGINGCLLSPSASGKEYADRIAEIFSDDARYNCMVRSSRAEYDKKLNWDTWGKRVNQLVRSSLRNRPAKDLSAGRHSEGIVVDARAAIAN
jgi:glycosyltransferase involved in cell wall biosynthesis